MAFKASTSRAPAAPTMYKLGTDKFYGIDASTSDENVSLSRACGISYYKSETENKSAEPGLVNFIRTNAGEIGKRCGVKPITTEKYSGYEKEITEIQKSIYAAGHLILGTVDEDLPALHIFSYADGKYTESVVEIGGAGEDKNWKLFHTSDNNFFAGCDGGVILGKLDDLPKSLKYITPSGICTLNSHDDSERYFYFDYGSNNNSYSNVISSGVKIPTVFISKTPSGGGTGYEPLNMFTSWVCEQYTGDGTAKEYNLSFVPNTIETAKAFVMSADGTWTESKISFSGNKIQFTTAPSKPVISGEDNVKIYYCRNVGSGVLDISKSTVSCNYGVAGYKDRLFLAGNNDVKNRVWFSAMDDYTYFPETSYLTFGDENTEIKMLAGQDSNLAVFTSEKCYLVSGTANYEIDEQFESDAIFTVSHIFESADPVPGARPLVFNNEIVYLSTAGLAAVTPSNVMDERYAQIRSERVNYWLLQEQLRDAKICICKDFLVIQPKHRTITETNKMYLLDGTQFSSANSKPFSYRQYEAYIWQGVAFNADHVWYVEDELHLYCFGNIIRVPLSIGGDNEDYTDVFTINGEEDSIAICASWETPNLYGATFYAKKSFSKLGILLRKTLNPIDNKEINTSVRVFYKKNNDPWKLLKDYSGEQSIFRYDYMNYGIFAYSPVGKTYDMQKKIKIKKTQSLKLRFENDVPGMPLYLQAFGLEYTF